jgi:hypothetical protein
MKNMLCKSIKVNKIFIAQVWGKIFTLKKYSEITGYGNPVTDMPSGRSFFSSSAEAFLSIAVVFYQPT